MRATASRSNPECCSRDRTYDPICGNPCTPLELDHCISSLPPVDTVDRYLKAMIDKRNLYRCDIGTPHERTF